MAKSPVYVEIDLSTTKSYSEKAVVDVKFLDILLKSFVPTNLEGFKENLKVIIDSCESMESITDRLEEHLYVTKIATNYNLQREKMAQME